MVAPNTISTRASSKALQNIPEDEIDLRGIVQECSKLSTRLTIEVKRRQVLFCAPLKLEMVEFLIEDQFTNHYVVFATKLIDGEYHAIPCWVGSKKRGLRKEFKAFGCFDDDMLAYLQTRAFVDFGRITEAMLKARNAAGDVFAPTGDEISAPVVTLDTSLTASRPVAEPEAVKDETNLKVIPFPLPAPAPEVTATAKPASNV